MKEEERKKKKRKKKSHLKALAAVRFSAATWGMLTRFPCLDGRVCTRPPEHIHPQPIALDLRLLSDSGRHAANCSLQSELGGVGFEICSRPRAFRVPLSDPL